MGPPALAQRCLSLTPERQTQEIKSLTAQEIDDLRNGRGMGFAMAAELNSYPGPAHILELAGDLQLTSARRRACRRSSTP